MAFENPRFDKLLQIGMLVKDIEAAKKNYEEIFGIGPWEQTRLLSGKTMDLSVNGERYTDDFVKVSMLHRYGFEIELIEPVGPSPLKEWVDKHGNGLHHIDVRLVGDYGEFLAECKEMNGKDVWCRGKGYGGHMDFSYVDLTEELGCYVEVKPAESAEGRPGFDY